MEFNSWNSGMKEVYSRYIKRPKNLKEIEGIVCEFADLCNKKGLSPEITDIRGSTIAMALAWDLAKKPYYSIYPKIVKSLLRVPLDIKMERLEYPTSTSTLLIRLARGHELNGQVRAILVASMRHGYSKDKKVIPMTMQCTNGEAYAALFECGLDVTLDTLINKQASLPEPNGLDTETVRQCMKLAVGVSLLDHDPELVMPDVLADDRDKVGLAMDPVLLAKLTDKAQRRGKVGWIIGACTEPAPGHTVSPHYRNPHFAIRWTGAGRVKPVLTSIKGSIIHRNKMTEIPTGYLEKEENG